MNLTPEQEELRQKLNAAVATTDTGIMSKRGWTIFIWMLFILCAIPFALGILADNDITVSSVANSAATTVKNAAGY